jgi:serine/threonine protein kinase
MSAAGMIGFNDARIYTSEITLAIALLHRFRLIYRDLNAENVLLEGGGHRKQTDLGLAKATRSFGILGLRICPGERISRASHSPRSDVQPDVRLLITQLVGFLRRSGWTQYSA